MFKKSVLVALCAVILMSGFAFGADADAKKTQQKVVKGQKGGNRERWPLAVQAYSFRKFTLFEAIEKTEECGIKYLEAYPNQVISKDILGKDGKPVKLWYNASDEIKQKIKDKLNKHNVKLINFGVTWLPDKEDALREPFEFAKEMGIRTFLTEPAADNIKLIDKLAKEYKVKVGIHNHPKRGENYKYWSPEYVLEVVKGSSRMVGASPDTGHWARSGLDPVEQIKKLKGRIVSVHLKDINESKKDVPFGTGVCKVREILEELNKQGFRGVFTIEYESNPENPIPDIKKCVEYFNKAKAEIKPVKRTKRPAGDKKTGEKSKKQAEKTEKTEKKK